MTARRTTRIMLGVMLLVTAFLGPGAAARATDDEAKRPIPVLAYYYIWFDDQSWDHAKRDYPLLGRYSSDDEDVMRQHIRWAKDAGIDGFIVSWKSTLVLDRRLERLIAVAREESFKLAIMYQGLDVDRRPLPVERIADDIEHFIDRYAGDPVFEIFERPMVIWSGTWEFSPSDIERVVEPRRHHGGCQWSSALEPRCILMLATERNVEGVERLRGLVDGNAYYWSSVDPSTFPDYPGKLDGMRAAVKDDGGIWIAPAAPGFDARLIGGDTVVDRADGETLRTELGVAMASEPDAIGLISWNEFSENTHVEPSEQYASSALAVLADVENGRPPVIADLDSSAASADGLRQDDLTGRILALGLLVGLVGLGWAAISRRDRSPSPR